MSGTFVSPSGFVFSHLEKTGTSTLMSLIRHLDGDKDVWTALKMHLGERPLPAEFKALPVISSIRNPFTWYVSYWNHFTHVEDASRIEGFDSFKEWVKDYPRIYYAHYLRSIPSNVQMIKMENQTEEYRRVMENIVGSFSEEYLAYLYKHEPKNVSTKRDRAYRDYYDDETLELVLNGADPIFEMYYPDREFPP